MTNQTASSSKLDEVSLFVIAFQSDPKDRLWNGSHERFGNSCFVSAFQKPNEPMIVREMVPSLLSILWRCLGLGKCPQISFRTRIVSQWKLLKLLRGTLICWWFRRPLWTKGGRVYTIKNYKIHQKYNYLKKNLILLLFDVNTDSPSVQALRKTK